jgi:TRAP-type C4-dicarboxylate transport system substrate-binding protein
MYETGCNHFAWTRHTSIPDVFIAGKPFMNGLTSQEQEWVREAARNTVDTQRELWRDSEEKMLNEMTKNGMIINEDVDIPSFRAKVEPIYDRYVEKHGDTFAELCETIRELETGAPDGSAPTTEPSE